MDDGRRFEFLLALGALLVGLGVAFLQAVPVFAWVLIALGCAIFVWQGVGVFGWQEHVSRHQRVLSVIAIAGLSATGGYLLGRWQYQHSNVPPPTTPFVSIVTTVTPASTPASTVTPDRPRGSPKPRPSSTPQVSPTRTPGPKKQLAIRLSKLSSALLVMGAKYELHATDDRSRKALFETFKASYQDELRAQVLAALLEVESRTPWNRDDVRVIQKKAADPETFQDLRDVYKRMEDFSETLHDD